MPVRATYLTDAPTLDAFSDPVHLFNLNISWMIGAFLALSAFFHFLIILLYNHESSTWFAGEPTGGVPGLQEKGEKN